MKGYVRGKMRMNVEGDRLSSLPDDLIHKILSFCSIKDAIGTSVLSSRWEYVWTSMPYLSFSSEDFDTLSAFSKFVNHVLSGRNNLTEVYSVNLCFRGKASRTFVKRNLSYAFSHNIQQLNVVYLLEKNIEFPLSPISSQSLKHLSLSTDISQRSRGKFGSCFVTSWSTWELPSLTPLDLHSVTLCVDNCVGIFSKFANLKNLTIKHFKTSGSNDFSICHPRLSNLTLENSHDDKVEVVNVVAPQLENLTIKSFHAVHIMISAPNLTYLFYKGPHPLHLSTEGFHSLEKADIYVSRPKDADAHQLFCLLQQLHNVRYLTLSLEIVEIISLSTDLIIHQPSPFVNLKSLNIYPQIIGYWWNQARKKETMSTKLKSYLLDSSPGCSFTMVLREVFTSLHFFYIDMHYDYRLSCEKEKENHDM
ncbi:putative F-box domain, leucine-rich repeat domain superfamily, F-box-like domain superfamily [Helianthus anomalus]